MCQEFYNTPDSVFKSRSQLDPMGPMEYSMVFAQKMLKIRHGGHFDFSDFSDSDGVHGKKPSRTPRKLYKMPPSLYGGDYGGFTTLYIYIYVAWW